MTQHELNEAQCPACKGIGMRHPPHANAFGYLEYSRIVCRKPKKCGKSFDCIKYEAWVLANANATTIERTTPC